MFRLWIFPAKDLGVAWGESPEASDGGECGSGAERFRPDAKGTVLGTKLPLSS